MLKQWFEAYMPQAFLDIENHLIKPVAAVES
jgi:hypothetical protein